MSAPSHARDTALQAYLAPLRPWLDAPGVTDLCINRPGEVFVERHAVWQRFEAPELSFTHLQALARTLATYTGQHVDEQQPLLSATLLAGVPTVWAMLTRAAPSLAKTPLPDLRYITNSGGAMPRDTLEKLRRALPGR